VEVHPTLRAFLKYARWEEAQQQISLARRVYERALVELPDEDERNSEKLFTNFAKFEERQMEHDRTRVIYKYALDKLGREQMPELYTNFIAFEKKHGNREGIEEVIVGKRRLQYEEAVGVEPHNYDSWFDYVRLEEEEGDYDRVREVYERAVAQVPPVQEKRFWRRYIYLWINYALFEELTAEDIPRARAVYKALLRTIPHDAFTFAKAFSLAAHFEVRQRDLTAARSILGQGVGRCSRLGKEKVIKDYIFLERQLGEVDRCRTLYTKYITEMPTKCSAWMSFAELESTLGEEERCRAVYELAISQPALDMPEALWKQYIDFEIAQAKELLSESGLEKAEETTGSRVRELYERLLDRTNHVKVWISYATFEASGDVADGDDGLGVGGGMETARSVFRKAYDVLKQGGLKEERVLLLEAWRDLEKKLPRATRQLDEVSKLMPKKVKKRRPITGDDGEDAGWEEYYDYHFPDDQDAPMNLKILEMARMWKKTGDIPTSVNANEESDGPSAKKQRVDEEEEE
jgi:crooked neck